MYALRLYDSNDNQAAEITGSWHDHMRELFAAHRRKMQNTRNVGWGLVLVDTMNDEILLSYHQENDS